MTQARQQTNRDKPTIHFTAATLDKEIGSEGVPEPVRYGTKSGRVVVFPDPYAMEWERAEEFITKLDSFGNSKDALISWVGQDGYEAIKADGLDLRRMLRLVRGVQQHYTSFMGSPGESESSEPSSNGSDLS